MFLEAINRRASTMLARLGSGEKTSYEPASLPPFDVDGNFMREYSNVDLGVGITSNNPFFICATADCPNSADGDFIIIPNSDIDGTPGTTKFKVVEPMPDGEGLTMMELEEQ